MCQIVGYFSSQRYATTSMYWDYTQAPLSDMLPNIWLCSIWDYISCGNILQLKWKRSELPQFEYDVIVVNMNGSTKVENRNIGSGARIVAPQKMMLIMRLSEDGVQMEVRTSNAQIKVAFR